MLYKRVCCNSLYIFFTNWKVLQLEIFKCLMHCFKIQFIKQYIYSRTNTSIFCSLTHPLLLFSIRLFICENVTLTTLWLYNSNSNVCIRWSLLQYQTDDTADDWQRSQFYICMNRISLRWHQFPFSFLISKHKLNVNHNEVHICI